MKKAERSLTVGLALLLVFGLMLVRPPRARGAAGSFIKFAGIDGESSDSDHEKWSDLLTFSWASARSGAGSAAAGTGADKARSGDLTITKRIDRASPKLAEYKGKGAIIPSVIIDTPRTDGKPGRVVYTLKNVTIISSTASMDGKTEKIKLAYQSYRSVLTAQ